MYSVFQGGFSLNVFTSLAILNVLSFSVLNHKIKYPLIYILFYFYSLVSICHDNKLHVYYFVYTLSVKGGKSL